MLRECALVLLHCLLLPVSSAAHYPTLKNRPCCLSVTKQDMSSKVNVTAIFKQPARFPCVRAMIFNTDDGPICVNPEDTWVKKGKSLIKSLQMKQSVIYKLTDHFSLCCFSCSHRQF
uniref:Chemokine interleukin-8-like domain-containing protein n=1 Tax=Fundulus heteroclitus TaxID=8078 RepID=A0A3Q2PG36_FUNHE